MTTCRNCVELLSDYIDGTLPEAERAALEEHLSYCPPCITVLRTFKKTTKLCREKLSEAELPRELASGLHSFLKSKIPNYKKA